MPSPSPAAGQGISVVHHGPLRLRLLLRLNELQRLLDQHSFWASGRSRLQLLRMLGGSAAVVSVWQGRRLIGFGRATSDGVFRAVLWDVVVAGDWQSQGLGRRIVRALLQSRGVRAAERVYLMTTNSAGFYRKLGFQGDHGQHLLVRSGPTSAPASESPADPDPASGSRR